MLKAGANVILTTKGIDDMALKVRPIFKSNATPRMVLLCYLSRSSVQHKSEQPIFSTSKVLAGAVLN